jgi:myo-inositol-1(or 4)-monophosphatase
MINVGIRAARRAGRIITRAAFDIDTVRVARKQANDFVTEVDRAAEDAIIESLLGTFPSHTVLGEESGHVDAQGRPVEGDPRLGEHVWIVDPLDGTTNFIHGMPQYAVSIALMQKGVITQALVYDPARDELFTATRGSGAFLNDRRIRVSRRTRLDESLVGTGFPFRKVEQIDAYLRGGHHDAEFGLDHDGLETAIFLWQHWWNETLAFKEYAKGKFTWRELPPLAEKLASRLEAGS